MKDTRNFQEVVGVPMAMYYVRSHKRWLGVGGHPWVNTYEILTNNTAVSTPGIPVGEVAQIETFLDDLAAFEQTVASPSVYLERMVVSTWIPDSNPYNADELMSRPMGYFGIRTVVGGPEIEDLRLCLGIVRVPVLGNPGKLPLRGVLYETDKSASAQGIAQLTSGSTVGQSGADWISAYANVSPYMVGGGNAGSVLFAMIHLSSTETYVARGVTQFRPLGVRKVDLTHKYFDV